jgi:hypothetical protein
MSNLPDRVPSIEKLVQRIKTAEQANQKEIKITLSEGKELVYDLALISSKLSQTISNIGSKIDKLTIAEQTIDVKMDGGEF